MARTVASMIDRTDTTIVIQIPPRMYGPLPTMNSESTRPAFQRNMPSPPTRTIQTAAKINRRRTRSARRAPAISSTIGAGGTGGSTSAALCAWAPPPAWVIGACPQLARDASTGRPARPSPSIVSGVRAYSWVVRSRPPNHSSEKPASVPSECMSVMIWSTAATSESLSSIAISKQTARGSKNTGSPTATTG